MVDAKAGQLPAHGSALFGDEYFAKLSRRLPARVVAMLLLQAYERFSSQEAWWLTGFWPVPAGRGRVDGGSGVSPTVLVGLPHRLRVSDRARRLFDDAN